MLGEMKNQTNTWIAPSLNIFYVVNWNAKTKGKAAKLQNSNDVAF